MMQRALLCGATVGLSVALHALLAAPAVAPSEALRVVASAALAYGTVAAAVAALAAAACRRRSESTPEAAQRLGWAVGAGAAVAVFVAAVRLRQLAGFANQDLLQFVAGPLFEALLAALVVVLLAQRLPAKVSSRLWTAAATIAAFGALAVVLATQRLPAAAPAGPTPMSVLLVSVDTLRADRLGAYGRTPSFTPNLDRLAAESVLFETAIAPVALTGPSHTTMLTGLYPVRHGALRNGEPLRPDVETLPQRLARRGYRTAAFVSAWPLADALSGLASRFQTYDENLRREAWFPSASERVPLLWLIDRTAIFVRYRESNRGRSRRFTGPVFERDGAVTVDRALQFVAAQPELPFFAFVHLYEPHVPYQAGREYREAVDPGYQGGLDEYHGEGEREPLRRLLADAETRRRITALYEAEVAAADERVGRLLAGLARLGRDRDTFVVFVSDHGEGLGEHGELFDHSRYVYDTTLRVPWMIRSPDRRDGGRRVEEPVRLVDLAPTVLALLGERPLRGVDGENVLSPAAGVVPTTALGSAVLDRGQSTERHFVRTAGHKLIWTYDHRNRIRDEPAFEELFDLVADPGEQINLLLTGAPPAPLDTLRERMRRWVAVRHEANAEISPEVREKLRSLGYL